MMRRWRTLAATMWMAVLLFSGGNAMAVSGNLDAAESDALEFLLLYSEIKSETYVAGGGKFDSPAFALFAADEQRYAQMLLGAAEQFSFQVNREWWGCYTVLMKVDGLDLLCDPYAEEFPWKDTWKTFLPGAAYLEELMIRELRKALTQTDELVLTEIYGDMLDATEMHLLQFAKKLNQQPLEYEAQLLSQVEVNEALERAIALNAERFEINAGLNDAWYDPSTAGQGFSVSVFENRKSIFLSWLTFDTERPPAGATATLGDPGQRWLTAYGIYEGKQAELAVYSSSGGVFDASSPIPEEVPIGSIFLRFEDCTAGLINYDLPGIGKTGSIPIERLAGDNLGACELNRPAGDSQVAKGDEGSVHSPGACYASAGAPPSTFSRLFAVWGSSGQDVFAVGGSSTIVHFNGVNWVPMTWGGGFGFEGVWGSSGTNVYAVGGYDGFGLALGKIFHYDGDCWREVFSTTDYQFTDVWGSGSDDVFATTSRGAVLHYDGKDWTPMKLETGLFAGTGAFGVWGTGAENVFAVDAGTIWHYDGNNWQLAAAVDASVLRRIWGSSPTDVYTVGQRYTSTQTLAAVWHYDGYRWTFVPSAVEGDRWGVWGSSSDDVFIVGNSAKAGLISHFDGLGWNTTTITITPTLQGVWGSSANDVYAVGGGARNGFCCSGEGAILHFDGNSWKTVMEAGQFK